MARRLAEPRGPAEGPELAGRRESAERREPVGRREPDGPHGTPAPPVRVCDRDRADGRPRGHLRAIGLSRVGPRGSAHRGFPPGLRKSSWSLLVACAAGRPARAAGRYR
ncbi:30S ribosomal protein S14 [Streptomyces olivaceoviridis]|uniref:30S ribosomal protein S14 n=1 Tax=Streptomyces olivaceoviridis TaxID=1921 RepID=UPI00368707C2